MSDQNLTALPKSCQVGTLPTVFYIPEYVTAAEEASIVANVVNSRSKWTQLSGRRLQNYGGTVHQKGLIQTKLPDWLTAVTSRLHKDTLAFGDKEPNHVLVNAYKPGEGIMAHEDGPLYFPGVCILSLASPAVLRFYSKGEGGQVSESPAMSVLCMPRSLLVFKDEAYTHCLHGIQQVAEEELDHTIENLDQCSLTPGSTMQRGGERISLTVRRVLKTYSNLLRR